MKVRSRGWHFWGLIVLLVAGVVTLALGALMGIAMQRAGLLSAPVPEASAPRA